MKKFIFLMITLISISSLFIFPQQVEPEIIPGAVVVKLKSTIPTKTLSKSSSTFGISSLDAKLQKYGVLGVAKMFKHKPIPANSNIPDISKIVEVQIPEEVNPLLVINDLNGDENIEYAEPVYKRYFYDIPNDPQYPQQDHFQQIKAEEAWNIQKGDSSIIIAIVDTGVDYFHEDLADNLWTNELELNGIKGIDDDANGFVDDIHGWDFWNNDSDPINPPYEKAYYYHGTGCAGIACATTNNSIGISGISWNCEYMPIKAADENTGQVIKGFEGIVYAVDNGAKIISCSWGSPGYSKWEKEIIDYAYYKGVITVFAAGNNSEEAKNYPASYQNVISVCAVNSEDKKQSKSTYGPWVDIASPSEIITTLPGNQYGIIGGTSSATPLVAGIIGLVRAKHPEWTNDQIIKQVLLTSDEINDINVNYRFKLGHGRVNVFNALSQTELKESSARLDVFSFEANDSTYGNNNSVFDRGEIINLQFNIQNFSCIESNDIYLKLTSNGNQVEIINELVGPLYFPGDTIISNNSFSFRIKENAEPKSKNFNLEMYTTKGYSRNYAFQVSIGLNPILFIDHDVGLLDVEMFYTDIFQQKEVLYEYVDIGKEEFPNISKLSNYPILLLSCSMSGSIMEDLTISEIIKYLQQGGNLFICGQDIGKDFMMANKTLISQSFFNDYLNVEYISNSSESNEISGEINEQISKEINFYIFQPLAPVFLQSPDVINPIGEATPIFFYGNGNCAGIKYSGNHKVVYLPYGLEAIDSDENTQLGDMSPIRTEVLMRSLNWLNFIEHKPLSDIEDVSVPRIVSVSIGEISPDVKSMILNWREKGETEFSKIKMTESSGNYLGEIPATNKPTSIEYYIESEHEYYNWQSPVGAPNRLHSYYTGADTIKPEIYVIPIPNNLSNNANFQVESIIVDNFSIDTSSVYMHYRLKNATTMDSTKLIMSSKENAFIGEIESQFNLNDIVEYRVIAKDQSSLQNYAVDEWQSFEVGYEDFENDLDNWIVSENGWAISNKKHGGNNSVHCTSETFYEPDMNVSLVTKYGLDLTTVTEASLTFWSTYRMKDNKDFGYVNISIDNGSSWELLKSFSGSKLYWDKETVSLENYIGGGFENVLLQFQFISDETQTEKMYGWYIDDIRIRTQPLVSVEQIDSEESDFPNKFSLSHNYPNPFNPSTTIKYSIPSRTVMLNSFQHLKNGEIPKQVRDDNTNVSLKVYDILGREVATLVNQKQKPGNYEITWDANNQTSGIYFYKLQGGEFTQVYKMLLIK